MSKCKYETDDGMCNLNECMYGDFLVFDDSSFDSGKYCYCDDVTDKYVGKLKEQKNERTDDAIR